MKHKEWTALQGRRLAEARKKSGYTQERAAAEGLFLSTHTQISNWENGKGDPSLSQIWTLCNMYGCDLGYILGEPGYENGTRVKTDIAVQTGLPAPAVEHLVEIKNSANSYLNTALKYLLSESNLQTLYSIGRYITFGEEYGEGGLDIGTRHPLNGEEVAEALFLSVHRNLSSMRKVVLENGDIDPDPLVLPVDSSTDRKIMEQIEARYWAGKDKGAQNG